MRTAKMTLLVTFIFIAIVSCKKELPAHKEQKKKTINKAKVFKTPSTADEVLLVENLGKITEIFKELYKDKSNAKVVNAAIFSKAFSDKTILLKDLIYPTQSCLNKVNKFDSLTQEWNVSLTKFAANFWVEVNKINDPSLNQFLNELIKSNEINSTSGNRIETENTPQVSVYFPYSEEFMPPNGGTYQPITTIAGATADADEGWGNLPFYDVNGIFQYYVEVVIDDNYAFANPTHIIGVNGITPEPNGPPPPPPPPPGVSRVFIGEGICKEHYDHLISFTGNGGGSEIKYCHLTGYLQPVNGHITTFQDIVSVNFSRSDIRQKKWVRTFTVWDDDWAPNDLEQFLGIYEEDNTNTRTFNGTVSTTLDSLAIPLQASIGFTISVTSQDDIIRQLKISRHSYFSGAFQNQGQDFSSDATFLPLPFTHGWPAYDVHYWSKTGANVGWTWPYNTF